MMKSLPINISTKFCKSNSIWFLNPMGVIQYSFDFQLAY